MAGLSLSLIPLCVTAADVISVVVVVACSQLFCSRSRVLPICAHATPFPHPRTRALFSRRQSSRVRPFLQQQQSACASWETEREREREERLDSSCSFAANEAEERVRLKGFPRGCLALVPGFQREMREDPFSHAIYFLHHHHRHPQDPHDRRVISLPFLSFLFPRSLSLSSVKRRKVESKERVCGMESK